MHLFMRTMWQGCCFELKGVETLEVWLYQEPMLEDDEDDDDDDQDTEDEVAAAGGAAGVSGNDWKCDDGSYDGPSPCKARRQTFDGPLLPLDADTSFALPGITSPPC